MKKVLKIIIIFFAIVFIGFLSGALSIYIIFNNDYSKIPLLNQIDISKKMKNTNVIVEKTEEIHIDKDIALQDSYKNTKNVISYIAKTKNVGESYYESDIIGFGINITSDGYIITNNFYIKSDLKNLKNPINAQKYVVILSDSRVFNVSKIIKDKYGFVILKIDAQKIDIPSFSYYDDLNIGSMIFSNSGKFGLEIDYIRNKKDGAIELLNNKIENKFGVFDLSNKLVGVFGENNILYSTNYLKNIIASLTNNKGTISRPAMDFKYTDYANLIGDAGGKTELGFYIDNIDEKNIYGLKKGDLILEING